MLINRILPKHLKKINQYFPILSLTGPRQAGKTTLLSNHFPDYTYLTLESLDVRQEAQQDPRSFLERYNRRVIFDEAQLVPELFNYLQELVDEDREPGRFILSGSQNFLLHKSITQSLAGRVAITILLPLDLAELRAADRLPPTPADAIYQGFYPNPYAIGTPPEYFYPSYVASYLERDVQGLISAGNLKQFHTFMEACAHFSGQLLNYERLAQMAGINRKTVNDWLSILETSYIVFRLTPHFENFGKRITKSPKLYFYDTGLLCYLLDIRGADEARAHRNYGSLFENLIVADRNKTLQHRGERPRMSFFRDSNGLEADLFEGGEGNRLLTEIKSSTTFSPHWDKNIRKIGGLNPDVQARYRVIYGGKEEKTVAGTEYLPWFAAGRE